MDEPAPFLTHFRAIPRSPVGAETETDVMKQNAQTFPALTAGPRGQRMRAAARPTALHLITEKGLVYSSPSSLRARFAFGGLLRVVLGLWVLKVLAVVNLGPGRYDERIEAWAGGNPVEAIAALFLQNDPVTMTVYGQFRMVLRVIDGLSLPAIF